MKIGNDSGTSPSFCTTDLWTGDLDTEACDLDSEACDLDTCCDSSTCWGLLSSEMGLNCVSILLLADLGTVLDGMSDSWKLNATKNNI